MPAHSSMASGSILGSTSALQPRDPRPTNRATNSLLTPPHPTPGHRSVFRPTHPTHTVHSAAACTAAARGATSRDERITAAVLGCLPSHLSVSVVLHLVCGKAKGGAGFGVAV